MRQAGLSSWGLPDVDAEAAPPWSHRGAQKLLRGLVNPGGSSHAPENELLFSVMFASVAPAVARLLGSVPFSALLARLIANSVSMSVGRSAVGFWMTGPPASSGTSNLWSKAGCAARR